MFSKREKQPPQWELRSTTQNRIAAAVVAVLLAVVLVNLASDAEYDYWSTPTTPDQVTNVGL